MDNTVVMEEIRKYHMKVECVISSGTKKPEKIGEHIAVQHNKHEVNVLS